MKKNKKCEKKETGREETSLVGGREGLKRWGYGQGTNECKERMDV